MNKKLNQNTMLWAFRTALLAHARGSEGIEIEYKRINKSPSTHGHTGGTMAANALTVAEPKPSKINLGTFHENCISSIMPSNNNARFRMFREERRRTTGTISNTQY